MNSVEREYFDLPKRGRGRYRCGLKGHFVKICKTKEADTNRPKKGNIHQVTYDDDFAFTLQSSGRHIPTIDIEL